MTDQPSPGTSPRDTAYLLPGVGNSHTRAALKARLHAGYGDNIAVQPSKAGGGDRRRIPADEAFIDALFSRAGLREEEVFTVLWNPEAKNPKSGMLVIGTTEGGQFRADRFLLFDAVPGRGRDQFDPLRQAPGGTAVGFRPDGEKVYLDAAAQRDLYAATMETYRRELRKVAPLTANVELLSNRYDDAYLGLNPADRAKLAAEFNQKIPLGPNELAAVLVETDAAGQPATARVVVFEPVTNGSLDMRPTGRGLAWKSASRSPPFGSKWHGRLTPAQTPLAFARAAPPELPAPRQGSSEPPVQEKRDEAETWYLKSTSDNLAHT